MSRKIYRADINLSFYTRMLEPAEFIIGGIYLRVFIMRDEQ